MPSLPAVSAEPRHSCGGAGGAGRAETTLPSWRRQKVYVPKRVWGSGHYSPGAVAYHAQLTALDQRRERCRAGVQTLAGYMGDSKRTGERYLAELAAPGPDGIPEMTVIRHTDPGGTGTTAERRMRRLDKGEHWAYVPVAAAKTLRHPLFVAYCALTYADATGTPVTAAELASLLHITERSARRLTGELQALGWITVHRRTGHQGRHDYTVHDHPLRPVPATPGPDTDGGSGPDTDGGSLAMKEDPVLTDDDKTQAGGTVRRRRDTGKWVGLPVDNPHYYPVASPAAPHPYTGPPLTLSPRVWATLAPVADLLPGISPYLMRRIAREIGHQLDTYATTDRITDRIATRRTGTDHIRDPGRWLLAALTRYGCPHPDCESGWLWTTRRRCTACAHLTADRRTRHPPHTADPEPALPPTGTHTAA